MEETIVRGAGIVNLECNVSDLRREVAKTESDLRLSLSEQSAHIGARFVDMHDNIRDAKEEAMKANFETRLALEKTTKDIQLEVLKGHEITKVSYLELKLETQKEFFEVKRDLSLIYQKIADKAIVG